MQLDEFIAEHIEQTLNAYRAQPARIIEDARQEEAILSGGYGHRQLFELIQNAADAISESRTRGRVELRLTSDCLYCANEGVSLTEDGIRALLMSHLSPKRHDEIGRFGIGFKSVLGICSNPEIINKDVSFRFNPAELAEGLRSLIGTDSPLPQLRTAALLSLEDEVAQDDVLGDLLAWATTVVRLRLKDGVRERLASEIDDFPDAFLAFTPHVSRLEFVHEKNTRTLSVNPGASGTITISDNSNSQCWQLFQTIVLKRDLTEAAQLDMDMRLRERDALPLMWAVPLDSAARHTSSFWAFFPTKNDTTLRGILNAPWKTNSDRENLLEGDFNSEMLRRAAQLVADSVMQLNSPDDPARFLDVLPARDDKGWADRQLSDALISILKDRRCMPRSNGDWDTPSAVMLRPDIAEQSELSNWFTEFGPREPDEFCHRSVAGRERRARARRLGCDEADEVGWLRSTLSEPTAEASIAAIHLADACLRCEDIKAGVARIIRAEPFVLTADGRLVPAIPSQLGFADGDTEAEAEHDRIVHPSVAAHAGARQILEERFDIHSVDMLAAFKALIAQWGGGGDANGFWNRFWKLTRAVGIDVAKPALKGRDGWSVKCRSLAGSFEPLFNLLLPGRIADVEDRDAKASLIDLEFHNEDSDLLNYLGAGPEPCEIPHFRRRDHYANDIYDEHLNWADTEYRRRNSTYSPQDGYLGFRDAQAIAPFEPIRRLKGSAAVRMTEALLLFARTRPLWTVGHDTRRDYYPLTTVDSASLWAIKHYGRINTSLGPALVAKAVAPQLREWANFLPVANINTDDSKLLELPTSLSELPQDFWQAAFDAASEFTGPAAMLGKFYARAAEADIPAPGMLRCRFGDGWTMAVPSDVILISNEAEFTAVDPLRGFFLCVTDAADASVLVERWSLNPTDPGELKFIEASEPLLVEELFPELARVSGFPAEFVVQPCEELWLERCSSDTGSSRTNLSQYIRNNCLYFTGERNDAWILDQLAAHFPNIVQDEHLRLAEARTAEELHVQLIERVRQLTTIPDKLLAMVGVEQLRSRIPQRHLQRVTHDTEPTPLSVATLALAVHSAGVLQVYRDSLVQNGYQPPRRWNGDPKAVAFVRDLGFPEEYAGYSDAKRSPWEDTIGPVTLNDLHPYQKRMRNDIVAFLNESTPGRGMLSLPTGAGKTRVAVQSIIEWLKNPATDRRVLWIAQSDELCEQAVESWLQAWRALGPLGARLRVNRMWGRTNDRVRPPQSGSTLVVSTFHTLLGRLERRSFEWALTPDVVVIDEAHGATAPSYTRILRRLGLDQRETRVPLIGLTATPFRGDNDERETYRLAFRFEHRRFDTGFGESEQLYRTLQDMGVLAWADHDELTGVTLVLDHHELEHLKRFMDLPASVEERLSNIEARNERILDHIRKQPSDWPILVFAASVEHAEDLAVRLAMDGVSAAAISGSTPTDQRRYAISCFKSGRLRVLTNYGVLTTGFDAPAIRAVYITRPIYSPVLYQQMIGRGLRGPLNGGKERCLIVNVTDNVAQYGEKLAFHKFEHLWRR
jgi:superfamily II DNA or RNA helicase